MTAFIRATEVEVEAVLVVVLEVIDLTLVVSMYERWIVVVLGISVLEGEGGVPPVGSANQRRPVHTV